MRYQRFLYHVLCLYVYVFTTGPQCEPVNITTCKCEHVNITKCAILYKRLLFIIITVYISSHTDVRTGGRGYRRLRSRGVTGVFLGKDY